MELSSIQNEIVGNENSIVILRSLVTSIVCTSCITEIRRIQVANRKLENYKKGIDNGLTTMLTTVGSFLLIFNPFLLDFLNSFSSEGSLWLFYLLVGIKISLASYFLFRPAEYLDGLTIMLFTFCWTSTLFAHLLGDFRLLGLVCVFTLSVGIPLLVRRVRLDNIHSTRFQNKS